ncbi:hypothetical protein P8917_10025 [Bacillus atrophaeus]|uniref:hypothetical protein n=1 Tax=Bacillus atrophaeus TaxID=1452 RepID=UPI00227DFCC2|nr:hypothetical protein [Bacillus atrophaeus]MCY8497780.1 hypothetical protein [Bacillus atrophaeus]MCY8814915.1 hypothetical protein [Bacillus atrophaeus]MCY8821539.1 hypothetical protein [Bacillus atrophaeus]MCY8831013.1 hypothetical protein [Bacillus atrophaeus]MCY8835228.1 hypothetical protein [Bacillus atrophaeus]
MTAKRTIHSDNYNDRFIFVSDTDIPKLIRKTIITAIQTASIEVGTIDINGFKFEFDGGLYNEETGGSEWTIEFIEKRIDPPGYC